jgi:hypothetical protein
MYAFSKKNKIPINNQLLKKYVALHIESVPTDFVYANIGTDYQLMKMKNHGTKMDLNTFLFICSTGLNQVSSELTASKMPVFKEFVDACLPRLEQEQAWMTETRADKWKDRAIFLAINTNDHVFSYDVVSKLLQSASTDKIKKICSYQFPDKKALAVDIGNLIDSIHVDTEIIAEKYPLVEEQEEQQNTFKIVQQPKSDIKFVDKAFQESNLNLREQLEPFRKRSNLLATVDTTKLTKQFLLSALNVKTPPTTILGKNQKQLEPITSEEKGLIPDIIDIVKLAPPKVPFEKNSNCDAIIKITKKQEWTPHALLKTIILPEHNLSELELRRYQKIQKETQDSEIINMIINLSV